jgi:hypothetical protein
MRVKFPSGYPLTTPTQGGWNAVAFEINQGTDINDLDRSINLILR